MGFLRDLVVRIKGDNSGLDTALKGSESKVGAFKGKVMALGAAIAGAVVGAFAIWKKAMESTEGTMDTLERMTAAVKGGFQGLMMTIATGDWGGLIDNITKTAKAYKDLAAAQDMITDIEASNTVKKAYLEKTLQAARVAANAATDPALKAQYIQEAIDSQKAITDITVSENRRRMEAFESSLKTMAGLDDEASKLMIENFRKIAGNWETFYGDNGQLALMQLQKEGLAYKDQLSLLTEIEKVEYKRIRSAVANLELFKEMQANMKPEQFNEYIKSVGEYINAIARGDQELFRLTGTLASLNKQLEPGIKRSEGINKVPTNNLTIPSLSGTSGGALSGSPITALTQGLTESQEALLNLSDTFAGFFSDVNLGFQGMIDGVITGIKRLVMELIAKAAFLLILSAITGVPMPALNTLLPANVGKLIGGGKESGAGLTGMSAVPAGVQNINVMGSIKGKDIALSLRRYEG